MSDAPKVFLSHASEDKKRFVIRFATELRNNGVDVWLDNWEILPGDSLVDKLFEEGLKSAAAVIIVISSNSVNKKWVREELNAAIVARVARQTKIIPVVIDECEVPEPLKSTVWEKINDLERFEGELQRILSSIFEKRERPPLGPAPAFVSADSVPIYGLQPVDVSVLKAFYEDVVESNGYVIQPEHIFSKLGKFGIGKEAFTDALSVMDEHHYVEVKRAMNASFGTIFYLKPTHYGFMSYAEAFLPQFADWRRGVALQIVNHGLTANLDIGAALKISQFAVDQILEEFSGKNWVNLTSKSLGGTRHILEISPSLKRQFQ